MYKKYKKRKPILSDTQVKQIIEFYKNNKSSKEIAKHFGVSNSTIKRCLQNNNITKTSLLNQEETKDIIQFYKEGKTLVWIADRYNVSRPTIKKCLTDNNITIRSKIFKLSIDEEENIVFNYINFNISMLRLSKLYNVSENCINDCLKRHNVPIRKRSFEKIQLNIDQIKKEYLEGLSLRKIAEKHNVSDDTISKRLQKTNIRIIKEKDLTQYRQEMIDLYELGFNTTELAKKFDVCPQTISYHLKKSGVKLRDKNDKRIKHITRELLIQDYVYGRMSITEVSQKYGVGEGTIFRRLQEYNIMMREKNETREKIPKEEHQNVVRRWKNGKETCKKMSEDYDCVPETISYLLQRNNISHQEIIDRGNGWNGRTTDLGRNIRACKKYREYRQKCFERDHFICQKTGQKGGKLNAHHIKSFRKIFKEFLESYPQFDPNKDKTRLLKLAQDYEPFWDLNNVITVSEEFHKHMPK